MIKSAICSAVVAAAIVAVPVAPASANQAKEKCSQDGHNLTVRFFYGQTKKTHNWRKARFKLSGSGTGGKSNVYFHLTVNDETRLKFEANPEDDLDDGRWYTANWNNFRTKRVKDEDFYVEAVFDEAGPDDKCKVKLNY